MFVPVPETSLAPDLSVVIPAYNEEARLTSSVKLVLEYLRRGTRTYELIVVDDGSSDGPAGTVAAMNAAGSGILLVRHPVNLGKGAAVRTGVMVVVIRGDRMGGLIVILTIPTSCIVGVLFLYVVDQTINIMTSSGLALAIGMLVDESTVTIENIHQHLVGVGLNDCTH